MHRHQPRVFVPESRRALEISEFWSDGAQQQAQGSCCCPPLHIPIHDMSDKAGKSKNSTQRSKGGKSAAGKKGSTGGTSGTGARGKSVSEQEDYYQLISNI